MVEKLYGRKTPRSASKMVKNTRYPGRNIALWLISLRVLLITGVFDYIQPRKYAKLEFNHF